MKYESELWGPRPVNKIYQYFHICCSLCSVQATFLNPSLSPTQGQPHPSVIFYQLVLSDQRAHPSLLSLVNSVQQLIYTRISVCAMRAFKPNLDHVSTGSVEN